MLVPRRTGIVYACKHGLYDPAIADVGRCQELLSLTPAHSCLHSLRSVHSRLHRVHNKSDTKDLTRAKEVMIQSPFGLRSITARICPAGHNRLHNVRQKASSPSAKANPHSVYVGPAGGLEVDLKA